MVNFKNVLFFYELFPLSSKFFQKIFFQNIDELEKQVKHSKVFILVCLVFSTCLSVFRNQRKNTHSCLNYYISNSLIIHEENTKEINTETEFGYVMKHLHKIKPTFISIFSLNTDLFEMLYQTFGRVFHQVIQTPRSC